MRVRRHHAWGAVLIVLFVLPIVLPGGLPFLERPVGDGLAFFGRIAAINPQLWGSDVERSDGEPTSYARDLEAENAALREHMAQKLVLTEDLKSLEAAFRSRGHGALDRLPRVVVACVLRSTDPSSYRRSLLIDRGEEDGLVPGLAVVSGSVYVGKVEVVRSRSALVKLVTDRMHRLEIAVRTEANQRLTGFVRGRGRGAVDGDLEVRFLHVPEDAGRILPGAPVHTSNADLLIPPALVVGTVVSITDKDLDGMPHIVFKPAFDLGRSTHLMVLLPP